MSDMYTDIERSIYQTLTQVPPTVKGLVIAVFNNQVTKKDYPNAHGAISIMRVTDVYQPANGGGQSARISTKNLDGSFTTQSWPDGFDLMYQLTIAAETSTVNGVKVRGLDIVRAMDDLIRTALRPRTRMMLWDSDANSGNGAWTDKFVTFVYAGYINRDSPQTEIYNRVTNIRFEVFNYPQDQQTVPAVVTIESDTTPTTSGLTIELGTIS